MAQEPLEMTDEQLAYVQQIVEDIRRLGPAALLAQYCNWAKVYVDTLHDKGRGAREMRAEQAVPLVIYLQEMTQCKDTAKLMGLLHDSVPRAMFNQKMYGHETLQIDDAEEGINWIMDETRAYRGE